MERGRPVVESPLWWEGVATIAPAALLCLVFVLLLAHRGRRH